MLNVLHLINYPGRGGSEKYILSLAEKLHGRGCVFYLGYSTEGPMLEQAGKLGIQAFNIPMASPYDLRAAKMLRDLCNELSIDIVHTHFLRENYISVFSKMMGNRARLVNTSHLLNKKNWLVDITRSIFSLFVDRVIAVSEAVREHMITGGMDPRLIQVIYNGIDVDYWTGRRSFRIRGELGLDREDFVATSIARFSEEKGHEFLLEAVRALKRKIGASMAVRGKRIKFLLVGEGEYMDEYMEFARMLGVNEDVVFTGYREDIRNLLRASDLFISHSRSEALGISILEALCVRLPVIATNSGGPQEIVNEQSSCGIVVEYGDTDAMAGAILRFASDRQFYKTCRANAGNIVKEKFNLDKTASETYNLYKSVAGKE